MQQRGGPVEACSNLQVPGWLRQPMRAAIHAFAFGLASNRLTCSRSAPRAALASSSWPSWALSSCSRSPSRIIQKTLMITIDSASSARLS